MTHITSTITAFFISLLLLISSTTQAHAEILLPVSCDNVTKISVGQLKASDLGITIEEDPFLYFVAIYLTAEAAAKYNELASYSIILDVRNEHNSRMEKDFSIKVEKNVAKEINLEKVLKTR
jgi:uncharacterized protein YneR